MADMAKVMSIVREYSDARLADVLAGKDMSVPQFAAMTEAMGRKQLRQAVDGQQAQQQAQQPSVKDQLLAEQQAQQAQMGGIASLPAPNMEAMGEGMAGGGIIAFEDGGEVPGYAAGDYIDPLAELSGLGIYGMGADEARREALLARRKEQEDKERLAFLKTAAPEVAARLMADNTPPVSPSAAPAAAPAGTPPAAAPAGTPPAAAGLPAVDVSQASKFERRTSPFGQMSAEKVDFEGLKDKGLGEGLMKLSAGLLSAPGSKGFAAGIQALADSGAVSRKEINALKKDARDYDLNIKKADAAFEQGNDELGLKYTEAANLNKYRMASLNQKPGELRTLEAIMADPKLAALYKGGKGAGVVSRTDALKEWNDLPAGDKRKLQDKGVSDFNSYYSYLSTGLPGLQVVDTLGKDAKVRS
jgi:hypothetical protein